MVYVTDETAGPPPAKKPRSTHLPKLRSEADLAHLARLTADMNQIAESPTARAASESIKRLGADLNRFADSPATKAISDAMKQVNEMGNLAGINQAAESMKRLTEITRPAKPVLI